MDGLRPFDVFSIISEGVYDKRSWFLEETKGLGVKKEFSVVASMDVGNGKMSRANQLHKKNLGQPGVLVQFAQKFLQIVKHIP